MDTNRISAGLFGLGLVVFGTFHALIVAVIGLAILGFMANPKLGRSRPALTPTVDQDPRATDGEAAR